MSHEHCERVVLVRNHANNKLTPRFTRIRRSTTHSFDLLLMSRSIRMRLPTQLVCQGFACARGFIFVGCSARRRGWAARQGGAAGRRGKAAGRHGTAAWWLAARLVTTHTYTEPELYAVVEAECSYASDLGTIRKELVRRGCHAPPLIRENADKTTTTLYQVDIDGMRKTLEGEWRVKGVL